MLRDEFGPNSAIDVLVTFAEGRSFEAFVEDRPLAVRFVAATTQTEAGRLHVAGV